MGAPQEDLRRCGDSVCAAGPRLLLPFRHTESSSGRMQGWASLLLLAMQGSDKVDQIPDVVGSQHSLPCRHDFSSIGNQILQYPVREIRKRRNLSQILWASRKRCGHRAVPASFGTMACFAVVMKQLSSPIDRLQRAWNGVWRDRCPQEVQVIDPNASAHDQSSGHDPCHSDFSKQIVESHFVVALRRNWHASNCDRTCRTGTSSAPGTL